MFFPTSPRPPSGMMRQTPIARESRPGGPSGGGSAAQPPPVRTSSAEPDVERSGRLAEVAEDDRSVRLRVCARPTDDAEHAPGRGVDDVAVDHQRAVGEAEVEGR